MNKVNKRLCIHFKISKCTYDFQSFEIAPLQQTFNVNAMGVLCKVTDGEASPPTAKFMKPDLRDVSASMGREDLK